MHQHSVYVLHFYLAGIYGPEIVKITSLSGPIHFAELAIDALGDWATEVEWFDLSGEVGDPINLIKINDEELLHVISQIDDCLKSKELGFMQVTIDGSDAQRDADEPAHSSNFEGESAGLVSGQELRMLSAARDVVSFQLEQIVRSVIEAMKKMDASGLFSVILARHVWDEYCWQLQEGPFDEDDIGFGSTSGNFRLIVETFIDSELEKIPTPSRQLLTAYICEEKNLCDECIVCDCTAEETKEFVLGRLNKIAAGRSLDLIGPDRLEIIYYNHSLDGPVGDAFRESGEYFELFSQNADELLSKNSLAHKQVATDLLDHYMGLLNTAAEDSEAVTGLLTRFDAEIRALVMDKDLWPHIAELVSQLQESLDEM